MWYNSKRITVEELECKRNVYKEFERQIKILKDAQNFLCPATGSLYFVDIHNKLVSDALNEKIEKIRKLQSDLKI